MKKNYSRLFYFVFLLVNFLSVQNILATDPPLKKDDDGPGSVTNNVSTMSSLSRTTISVLTTIDVTANLEATELYVDFNSPVGTAVVSIVDSNGQVVYQTTVDTYSTPEVIIPVDGLDSVDYSLKISYDSTNLIGDFRL